MTLKTTINLQKTSKDRYIRDNDNYTSLRIFVNYNSLYINVRVCKGVSGGPSGPSREGPGVGHKIVSDTKQMTKERKKKKKMNGKGEKCVKKKKIEEREREKETEINGKR